VLSAEFAFDPLKPNVLSALTCLFLHDPENILHLLGNLVFLAAVGPLVEASLGQFRFMLVYLASGLAGVAAHWAVASLSGVSAPLIGASSAIAGCVGYCCVRYMRRRVAVAPNLRLSVAHVAVFWIVLQAVGAFVRFGDGGGTSYVAHIGGFVGGLLLAFVFHAQVEASVEAGREKIEEMSGRSPAAALAVAEEHLRAHPTDVRALWEKADALHVMGERDHEAAELVRLLRAGEDAERVLSRMDAIGMLRLIAPVERMRYAYALEGQVKAALLTSVAAEPDGEQERPHALLELATAFEEGREERLRELSEKYAFHPATELARAKGLLQ
jgi:membrane associated rhomboid family serine protease